MGLGAGAPQGAALLKEKLLQNGLLAPRGPVAAGSGVTPPAPEMLPPRLGSALGASGLPVHLWGQGQQMSVLQCHRELWLVRGTSWRRALGSVRDRWLCQIWLPEIVQDMRHLAGLQRPGLPGWPQGAGSVGPRENRRGWPTACLPPTPPTLWFYGRTSWMTLLLNNRSHNDP